MTNKKNALTTFLSWLDGSYLFLIIMMVLYQLYYIRALPYEPAVHGVVHLGFAMVIGSITMFKKSDKDTKSWVLFIVTLLGSVAVTSYFYFNYKVILSNPSYPPTIALVMGVIAAIVAIILVRSSFGWIFPIFAVVASAYVFLGSKIPGSLRAPSMSITRGITLLAADVTSPWGVYGDLVGLSANYLFLFIVFGSVLHAFGGLRFVIQIGNLVAAKLRSGSAALAIVSSALLGSITGSTAANITITGAFTIPLMKKAGYTPEQASAIEAAASNGGQFLPPIMGATVFVMAAYTGIPYIEIAKAAIVPALLYFFILLIYAELNARKLDIQVFPTELNIKELLVDAPLFVVPLATLVVLLLKGYSLMFVVFWSIVIVVVLGILTGIISGKGIDWNEVRDKIVEGGAMGCHVALILAVIGIVVAGIEVTGLSLKLSVVLGNLAGDSLFLLLILTMLTSLILGAGVPTPAAYVIVATVLSPALVRQGVPLMQAHLFPMFYAFLSHLTPPIGIGLIIACNLAESDYIRSAIEVFKAGFVSLFLPFCFIYTPALLLQYDDFGSGMLQILAVILLFFAMSIFMNRQWKDRMTLMESGIMLISIIFVICSLVTEASFIFLVLGLITCVVPLVLNSKRTEIA